VKRLQFSNRRLQISDRENMGAQDFNFSPKLIIPNFTPNIAFLGTKSSQELGNKKMF